LTLWFSLLASEIINDTAIVTEVMSSTVILELEFSILNQPTDCHELYQLIAGLLGV
jgi:hypothetical protein